MGRRENKFTELEGNIFNLGNRKQNIQSVKNLLRRKRFKGRFSIILQKQRAGFVPFRAVRK